MEATLLRTPLYERHVALGARMVPFAGYEMPVQYEGVIPEHKAVRTDTGVFDVSHMGEIHVDGPTAQAFLQSMLSNDVDRLSDGEAQYTLLTNEAGGIVDDLIAYRLAHGQFYLVVNASNRAAVYAWLKEREPSGTEVRDASDEYALLAVQGPRSLERLGLPDAPAFTHAMGELDGVEVMIARTGYTGELGVELCCAEDEATALWDAVLARGATPCGLGARDTLRLEVCYPLHGNDITPETDAISAGLGWACALDTDFTGVEGLRRHQGGRADAQARPVRHGGTRRPEAGHADRGRRRGHLGDAFPDARRRYRPGLRADPGGRARERARGRRPRQAPARTDRQEADLPEGELRVPAPESYPDDLRYHPEHDWARIDGDEAKLGITWFAQDSLGELVHYEAPESGSTVAKDSSYGEVESVKAVSDIVAPLSGEVLEVNQKVVEAPETVNDDPYGEGWLIRIRMSDASELDALMDGEAYRAHVADQ